MSTLIAVDPGDVHVGIAFFLRNEEGKWRCESTVEMDPDEFEISLAETFVDQDPDWQYLVYEKFRLYEDKKDVQVGSEFRTCKCIGVIEFLGRTHNRHVAEHRHATELGLLTSCEQRGGTCAADAPIARDPQYVELIKQPAEFHKRADKILPALGIKSVARKEKDKLGHRRVAEKHGWYFILRRLEEDPADEART